MLTERYLKGFFKKTGPYICTSLNAQGGSHFDTRKWNWSVWPDFNSTVNFVTPYLLATLNISVV